MRKSMMLLLAAVVVATSLPAFAELQNVVVGGSIRIRGSFYTAPVNLDPRGRNPLIDPWFYWPGRAANPNAALRWPLWTVPGRPIGALVRPMPAPVGVVSPFSWDDSAHNNRFVEERTRLNVRADFTDQVSAFIELDNWDVWGGGPLDLNDFRSNYITGVDAPAATFDDVEVYQAYIEAKEMWGFPVRLRVGRQEISLGSEWLVGVNDTSSLFRGLSFDAVRVTWNPMEELSVDAWWSKLVEASPAEEDSDVDFYGIYGSYTGFEDITLDAYWMFVRDGRMLEDFDAGWLGEWVQDVVGIDDYDPVDLHTIGLRGAGTVGAFDFEAEAAYQFGSADQVGVLFAPILFGDDGADYDEWAANLEVGYTFDVNYSPRVFLGVAYFGGEDNRDLDFWQWLRALLPFYKPDASVSFNRLFSNWEYSQFVDNTTMSNAWVARGGVSLKPTESLEAELTLTYLSALEEFDAPWHFWFLGRRIVPLAPLSFITRSNDDTLGWEAQLSGTYAYSEDLSFSAGWAHLFVDNGLEEGSYSLANGLAFNGGVGDDDADYLWVETKIKF